MSIRRKGVSNRRLPRMQDPADDEPDVPGAKEAGAMKPIPVQTTPKKSSGNLAQMVRSMQGSGYGDGSAKRKKDEKFQQLSDGREMGNDGGAEGTDSAQKQPKSGRMQAMFLSAGGGVGRDKLARIDRNERREILLEEMQEEEQMEENTEETKASKVLQMGAKSKSKGKLDIASILTGSALMQGQKAGEVKQASKKQKIEQEDVEAEPISEENTFGFVAMGESEFLTPGGKEIKFFGPDFFEIKQPNGDVDEVEIRGDKVVIFDEYGDEVYKEIPVSLVLEDGTKLTIGPGGEVGVTNRGLFAQVTNGTVKRNNRSTLYGGLKDELVDMGFSEAEATEKLEQAGNMISTLVPEDVNVDDLAQFNAADLDYLFRDGEYLVRDSEGVWTKDSVNASAAAKEAMREGSLMDTVWRMGGFCEEAENILFDYIDKLNGIVPDQEMEQPSA